MSEDLVIDLNRVINRNIPRLARRGFPTVYLAKHQC